MNPDTTPTTDNRDAKSLREEWIGDEHDIESMLNHEIAKLREQRDRAIEIADEIEQSVDNMFYAGGRVKLPVFKKLSKLKAEIK